MASRGIALESTVRVCALLLLTGLTMCASTTAVRHLAVGETATFTVPAREPNVRTGIILDAHAEYDVRATGKWYDASTEHSPDGEESEQLKRWVWLRRYRSSPWFTLMGVVNNDVQPLGSQATLKPRATGELLCYANDVRFMYWNNRGSVTVVITRTR